MHGRFPAAEILERHQSLEHLSIAGVGVARRWGSLQGTSRLTLSDNRIAGGLEHLVEAGLASLRDLDLSNNRIQNVDDLAPLARLRLVSLDLSTRWTPTRTSARRTPWPPCMNFVAAHRIHRSPRRAAVVDRRIRSLAADLDTSSAPLPRPAKRARISLHPGERQSK
ncbi:hypothetical protein ZWY2020_025268 [Hordeum vulgare]|nr:hypothetical protein ZWY2020_025268 [Hordeum vulgare]